MVCARFARPTSGRAERRPPGGEDPERDADERGDRPWTPPPARCARRGGRTISARCEARNASRALIRSGSRRSDRTCGSSDRASDSGAPQATSRPSCSTATRCGEGERFGEVVGDQQHRARHRGLQRLELAMQLRARDRIERAERLVHQQHRRIGGERPRQPDALPLPAGQLVRPAAAELRRFQADAREQFVHARRDALGRPIQQVRHHRHVGGDREMREQPDVLDGVAGLPPQRRLVPRRDAAAAHPHLTGIGAQHPVHQPQQRRLAAATAADQRHHLAFGDRQRDAAQHRAPASTGDDVEEVDHGD